MSQRKNYSRYFIILQEDEKGYGLASDKLPTGYAKLEVKNGKCKITFYVQNLKKEMKPYHMLLIFNKKNDKKLVKLGELNIDDAGRTELCREYDADNVAGTNIHIERIGGAAIVKFVDANMLSVMNGFTTTENLTDWKSFDLIDEIKIDEDTEMEDRKDKIMKPDLKKKPSFDEYEEKIEKAKEEFKGIEIERIEEIDAEGLENIKKTGENVSKENTENLEKTSKNKSINKTEKVNRDVKVNEEEKVNREERVNETDMVDEQKIVNKSAEEFVEIKNQEPRIDVLDRKENESKKDVNIEEKIENEGKLNISKNDDSSNKRGTIQAENLEDTGEKSQIKNSPSCGEQGGFMDFFTGLTRQLDPWEDDFDEVTNSKWYTIPVESIDDMYKAPSYNVYTMLYYPMINYYPYIIRHGHYLVGYKYDKSGRAKYIVYAIPGTKAHYDQPYGGKYGFVSWTQPKNNKGNYGNMGYWLMFYDLKKSVIVVPVNKTVK